VVGEKEEEEYSTKLMEESLMEDLIPRGRCGSEVPMYHSPPPTNSASEVEPSVESSRFTGERGYRTQRRRV